MVGFVIVLDQIALQTMLLTKFALGSLFSVLSDLDDAEVGPRPAALLVLINFAFHTAASTATQRREGGVVVLALSLQLIVALTRQVTH